MKLIAVLFACILIATKTTAFAAEKSSKKKKPKETPVTAISKQVVAPWKPVAYDDKAEQLPVGYSGLSPKEFYKMFTEKLGGLKKGEFETSEEFTKRTANKIALLAPINTTDLYAFKMTGIHIYNYNADAQAYFVTASNYYSCVPPRHSDWVTCIVDSIQYGSDTYTGSNSFGAIVEVQKSRGLDFSLAVHKNSPFISSMFKHENADYPPAERYDYIDKIPVPLEKARNLKGKSVEALFIGRVTDAKMVEGRGKKYSATMDSPYEAFIDEKAVPFELKKIIYYVYQTGEILHQKTF